MPRRRSWSNSWPAASGAVATVSGEALYERYKDALKRGHVASLRGRLEEALTAYAEAAAIAPERSTPHSSAGTALLRGRRPADALRHFEIALRLVPGDEAALFGRAQALAMLDRRSEAADAFDSLADVRAAAGRLAEAVDAARRGLELAEARHRRRTLGLLIARLRQSEPDVPGRVALERALLVLDGEAPGPERDSETSGGAGTEPEADSGSADEEAPEFAAAGERAAAGPLVEPVLAGGEGPAVDTAAGTVDESAVVRAALDRDVPADADIEALARAAEAALEGGDRAALALFLDLATASMRTGRADTALDACYVALSVAPDDVELHLALVELYDVHGWGSLAAEKLDLLARLAELDGDADGGARVAASRMGREGAAGSG